MPKFFVSYRRSDTDGRYLAHMLFRELRQRYGNSSVFLDVDSRSPGLSFPAKVSKALQIARRMKALGFSESEVSGALQERGASQLQATLATQHLFRADP